MDFELTMYLFVNSDLKMKAGKIAAQVGHAAQEITEQLVKMRYENNGMLPDPYVRYFKWSKMGAKKIVLKATQEQLIEMTKMREAVAITDSGRTQVAPGSLTVVGFYPSQCKSKFAKDYKLL